MDNFETAKQLFLDGLRLLEAKDFQAAETQFAKSLELLPDRVSTLNNLSAVKLKLNQFAEAEAFARKAVALDGQSPEAWSNLGLALAATARPEEALRAYDRALQYQLADARAWLGKAMTLLELKRGDEALPACEQALKLDPGKPETLYTKSLILKELQRPAEAQTTYRQALELRVAASPVFMGERRASQKADILILNQNPVLDDSLKSFEVLHLSCPNFPGQLARYFQEDFHFTYVFVGDAARRSAHRQIPQPDLVINNHANGEIILAEGHLFALTELIDSFGVPVVNHPAKAVQTTRDESANLLKDIPGIRVPKTRRFSSAGKTHEELVGEIEGQYDYPLITRTLAMQESKGMTKVDSRAALAGVLTAGLPEKFFVTEFVDTRAGGRFYRKIRAAVVQDEIIVIRADYDDHWSVHARKTAERATFYLENARLLAEEKRICQDPEAVLGQTAVRALRAIRERIPLDVFGIDFDMDAEGRLVFYEANATMNLFSTAHKEVPYPEAAEAGLKLAFQRYFTTLAARR